MQIGSADFARVIGFRQAIDVPVATADMSPHRVRVDMVSDAYFDVLGVPPAAGRLLSGADARTVPVPVVLSERLWRAAFDGDPAIAGRAVTVNGTAATVLGVARRFRGVTADSPADVFVPAPAALRLDPPPICGGFMSFSG